MSNKYDNIQNVITDMYQSWGKNAMTLMNLNIQTMQNLSKVDGVKDLMSAKQPDDFTKAQGKIVSELGKEVTEYQQSVLKLVIDSQKEMADKVSEITGEFSDGSTSGPSGKKAA